MKKILFIMVIIMSFIFSSCSAVGVNNKEENESTQVEKEEQKVEYGSMQVDWPVWNTARELVEDEYAAYVLTGTVTGISFKVIDKRTGLPPEKDAKEKYDLEYGENVEAERIFELKTLYNIDVITTYKGEALKSTQLSIMGGLKDYRVEEQLSVLDEYGMKQIYILRNAPEIKIGEKYLFVLYQYENAIPSLMNPDQSVYNLKNPFEPGYKSRFDNSAEYFSKDVDQNGYRSISAKDVISVFGKDKWDTFWAQWQKDNPDWEQRLDKEQVEKALAK